MSTQRPEKPWIHPGSITNDFFYVNAVGVLLVLVGFWPLGMVLHAQMTPAQRQAVVNARASNARTIAALKAAKAELVAAQSTGKQYKQDADVYAATAQQVAAQRDDDAVGWQQQVAATRKVQADDDKTHAALARCEWWERLYLSILIAIATFCFLFIFRPWSAAIIAVPYLPLILWGIAGAGFTASVLLFIFK